MFGMDFYEISIGREDGEWWKWSKTRMKWRNLWKKPKNNLLFLEKVFFLTKKEPAATWGQRASIENPRNNLFGTKIGLLPAEDKEKELPGNLKSDQKLTKNKPNPNKNRENDQDVENLQNWFEKKYI